MHTFQESAKRALVIGGFGVADETERLKAFFKKAADLALTFGLMEREVDEIVQECKKTAFIENPSMRAQELGGAVLTLAGVANAFGLDMIACGETEAERVIHKRQKTTPLDYEQVPPVMDAVQVARQELIQKVADVHAIAMMPGNAHVNHYMRGMANGLELAMSILTGRDVAYIGPEMVREDYPPEDDRATDPYSERQPSPSIGLEPTEDERQMAEAPEFAAVDHAAPGGDETVGTLVENDKPVAILREPESDGDFLARLGTDAEKWATAFAEQFGGRASFDDLRAWFANAIEAGRSAGYSDGARDAGPESDVRPV